MAIAEHLYRYRGMHVSPDHIIVGAGTEYLYSRLLQLLGKNAKFGVENPGYRKITKLYDVGGVTWDYVDIDGQGMKVEQLDQKGITVAHVSPEHHFPIGLVMPWEDGRNCFAGRRRNRSAISWRTISIVNSAWWESRFPPCQSHGPQPQSYLHQHFFQDHGAIPAYRLYGAAGEIDGTLYFHYEFLFLHGIRF